MKHKKDVLFAGTMPDFEPKQPEPTIPPPSEEDLVEDWMLDGLPKDRFLKSMTGNPMYQSSFGFFGVLNDMDYQGRFEAASVAISLLNDEFESTPQRYSYDAESEEGDYYLTDRHEQIIRQRNAWRKWAKKGMQNDRES